MKRRVDRAGGVVLIVVLAVSSTWSADTALRSETNYAPAWSPDGRRIAFEAKIDGRFAIVVMNADGTGLRRLTGSQADGFASSWSPDGGRIAFCSKRDGNREVYVMDADGANPVRLTREPAEDSWPRWSPDGRWIAFVSARSGRREIHVIKPDGTGVRPLTGGEIDVDGRVAWSPDGAHVLFRGNTRGRLAEESVPAFFYTVSVGDGTTRRLTDVARRDYNPVWAPGGARIAFDANRNGGWESDDGGWEIFSARPDGSDRRNLTRNAVNDWGPAWSPDGRQIAYCSGMDDRYEIHVMAADGSAVTRLTFMVRPR
jgi:TolB protein